jgi:pimeloyl-ACP methyl ester carboxylesterase
MESAPATVVLVHGSWIGPECWEPVLQALARLGVPALAVDRTDPARGGRIVGDTSRNVELVRSALARCEGPVVMCGHSAGCGVVTKAASGQPSVRELVYIAGFMTDGAETPLDLGGVPSESFARAIRRVFDDTLEIHRDSARDLFFHDCSADVARRAVARLRAQEIGSRRERDGYVAAWRDRVSTYVICADDRALAPAVQRSVSRRATKAVEWHVGHTPQLSRPDLVASLLAQRARACLGR